MRILYDKNTYTISANFQCDSFKIVLCSLSIIVSLNYTQFSPSKSLIVIYCLTDMSHARKFIVYC